MCFTFPRRPLQQRVKMRPKEMRQQKIIEIGTLAKQVHFGHLAGPPGLEAGYGICVYGICMECV